MKAEMRWEPNPGPQTQFLASPATEANYGGAAGGGKSDGLVMGALRNIEHPGYRALLLRRTYPELERSLIEKSRTWYPGIGGVYNEARKLWRFPSGAVIEFGHLEHQSDVFQYQSAEYQYIGFDELVSFLEGQYTYMISRARSAHGIPVRIRAATNPGGEGHDWVFRRWGPWLDPEFKGPRAEPGQVLHYRLTEDGEEWCAPGPGTLSRQFIPARVTDNPHLMAGDPGYIERLGLLDPVTRKQLRDGDWLVRPGGGLYFKREWFDVLDALPAGKFYRRCRYWDRAASLKGDYTVGLLMAAGPNGVFYAEDVVRMRDTPGQVEEAVIRTARMDGHGVMIGIEQDPGSAGAYEADSYVKLLVGYNVRAFKPTGDKVTRAQPVSAQSERRNVKLVRAPWNTALLAELEAFPEDAHDDQVDALSGAFNALAQTSGVERTRLLAQLGSPPAESPVDALIRRLQQT